MVAGEDDVRFQKIEVQVADHARILGEHGRRIDDVHVIVEDHGRQLVMQSKFIHALQESTATQKRMIEVGEALIDALGWVGKAAKWIGIVAGSVTAVCVAIKQFRL